MMWTLVAIVGVVATVVALHRALRHLVFFLRVVFDRIMQKVIRSSAGERLSTLRAKLHAGFPGTSRRIEARLTPAHFSGLPLTLLVVSALYVGALFGGLVEELLEADELVRLDNGINRLLDPLRVDPLVAIFGWITDLGGSPALTAVVIVTTALVYVNGHGYLLGPLWLTLLGSQATTHAGKYVIARARPEFVTEWTAVTPSFPSGHTTGAMAVYGFIAYLVARSLTDGRQRFDVIYAAMVLIGLVGFSRMFLSVHYASDVAAGLLVGGFWLLVGFALAEWLRDRNGAGAL